MRAATVEDIADDPVTAVTIIEVDGRVAVPHVDTNVMPEIVPDDVAAAGWITALVKRAAVVGFGTDVAHDVVFKNMVVAGKVDRLVRTVVDQVVGGPVPHPFEPQGIRIGQLVARKTPDVVVDGRMATRPQRLTVPPGKRNPPLAGIMDVAGFDRVGCPARNHDPDIRHIADLAGPDRDRLRVPHLDPVANRCVDGKPVHDQV